MTRVLLTGATGVLGTELRPRLRSAGFEVRAASREADHREASERASGRREARAERAPRNGERRVERAESRERSDRRHASRAADHREAADWASGGRRDRQGAPPNGRAGGARRDQRERLGMASGEWNEPRASTTGNDDTRAASRETDRREVSERAPENDSADSDESADSAVEWVELDLEAGTGIRTATDGVDVVVHAASDARGDHEAVDVEGTRRLLEAAAALDVEHFVYVSIVGIDEIPYSYYEHKLAAERAVQDSPVPSTVVRSTQFFPFVASILASVRRLPVWPLPTDFRLQPIDVGEAADAVVEHVEPPAAGRAPDVGGPAVHTGRELAEAYREACGLRRPIVRLPLPGEVAAAVRTGAATCPDRAVGTRTWREWLDARDGVPGADAY